MVFPQQKFREILFQLLFSVDFSLDVEEESVEFFMKEFLITKKVVRAVLEKGKQIQKFLPDIDALITRFSKEYEFDRIAKVEKNILRLGVFELCFTDEVPPKVAIAEAIRITRKFATKESASFVNAVLDALYQSRLNRDSCNKEEHDQLLSLSTE